MYYLKRAMSAFRVECEAYYVGRMVFQANRTERWERILSERYGVPDATIYRIRLSARDSVRAG